MYPVSHEKPSALGQPDVDMGRPYFPDGHCTAWLKPKQRNVLARTYLIKQAKKIFTDSGIIWP